MSNVVPLNKSSSCVTAEMLLDKAKMHVDNMDGVLLVWYEKGTAKSNLQYLISSLTPQDVNWFVDEIKTLLHSRSL